MVRVIGAVASSLSFFAYLIDNNSVKYVGFAWLRVPGVGTRVSGIGPRGTTGFGFGVLLRIPNPDSRLLDLPFSDFQFPVSSSQFSNRGGEKGTNFSGQPRSIPNITKGPSLNISFAQKSLML